MQAIRSCTLLMILMTLWGCADGAPAREVAARPGAPVGGEDLGLGDFRAPKGDSSSWGAATTCKEIPEVEPLKSPMIVISLDGMTLRLFDLDGDYDRTFPVGVGAIEDGVSLTPTSTHMPGEVFYARADWAPVDDGLDPEAAPWAWNQKCRIWWTDPETGEHLPVFAGLPWIRLEGPPTLGYGLHGPIDNFAAPHGGDLRRGYVSHGCVRMAAEGIAEVWGRIQGHKVPVRIQKAPERRPGDVVVDVEDNWLLSACRTDADCRFDGGVCKRNEVGGEGFCTMPCQRYCPDKAGHPTSFCVADPDDDTAGICTLKAVDINDQCRRYDHFTPVQGAARFNDPVASADVCLPGTEGWIGDRCLADDQCQTGLCVPVEGGPHGVCSQACDRYCPDLEGGFARTFCVDAPASVPQDGGMCVATCSTDDDCAVGTACQNTPRSGQPEVSRRACVPAVAP